MRANTSIVNWLLAQYRRVVGKTRWLNSALNGFYLAKREAAIACTILGAICELGAP